MTGARLADAERRGRTYGRRHVGGHRRHPSGWRLGRGFGSTAATSFVVNSTTQITAVVPPGVSGGVDVTVTTPNATSPTSSADTFNYVGPPVVTGLTTTATPAGGRPAAAPR